MTVLLRTEQDDQWRKCWSLGRVVRLSGSAAKRKVDVLWLKPTDGANLPTNRYAFALLLHVASVNGMKHLQVFQVLHCCTSRPQHASYLHWKFRHANQRKLRSWRSTLWLPLLPRAFCAWHARSLSYCVDLIDILSVYTVSEALEEAAFCPVS